MTYISGYRGEGKTVELIRRCAKNDGLIISTTGSNKHYILETAAELGLKIREPLTISEVIAGKARGLQIKNLYIDETDILLKILLNEFIPSEAEITASINRENIYTLSDDLKELSYLSERAYSTVNDSSKAITFGWEVTATPCGVPWDIPSNFVPYSYGSYRNVSNELDFSVLTGKVITKIDGLVKDSEQVIFSCSDGEKYIMFHEQDCCESVTVADVYGNLSSLIGSPITLAECSTKQGEDDDSWGTSTWTFYKLATVHGYVDIRWLGESNGYYSEAVSFCAILPPKGENNK